MVSCANRRAILSLFLALFIASGCVKSQPKPLQDLTSKTILFITKDFSFYDVGIIKKYKNHTDLTIFNAGVALIEMNCYKNKVCINNNCYSQESINRRFFSDDSFSELDFITLLEGKEIFNGENKKIIKNGFIQELNKGYLKATYKVTQDSISFRVKDSSKKNIFVLEIDKIQGD